MKKDLHIRISEANYKILKKKVKELNLTQTEIIEKFISDGKIVVITELIETQKQLRYIGNNLNQLTKLCHEGRIKSLDLEELKKEVRNVWQSLNLLIQRQNWKH